MSRGLAARGRRLWAPVFALAVVAWPRWADACSVCMSGREDENQLAFLLTTAFLSIAPLAMIGGIALYIRSLIRRAQNERPAERAAAEPVTKPITEADAAADERWRSPLARSH